jgi:hypothetical protein
MSKTRQEKETIAGCHANPVFEEFGRVVDQSRVATVGLSPGRTVSDAFADDTFPSWFAGGEVILARYSTHFRSSHRLCSL